MAGETDALHRAALALARWYRTPEGKLVRGVTNMIKTILTDQALENAGQGWRVEELGHEGAWAKAVGTGVVGVSYRTRRLVDTSWCRQLAEELGLG